jgi:hypothetical protein
MNLHPLEKRLFVVDATLTIVTLSAAIIFESTALLAVAIVAATVPSLVQQWVLPSRLGSWRRYRYGVESPNSTIARNARKSGARPSS